MGKFSAKNKIYFAIALWLVVVGLLFGHFFYVFDRGNQDLVSSFSDSLKKLDKLKAEQESYRLANKDLENVKLEHVQPDEFFSRDVTLVKEIQTLESLASKYSVEVTLNGISGTLSNAPKAPTKNPLFLIPYGVTVKGDFSHVVNFIENLEHLPFVTTINSVTVSVIDEKSVAALLTANFYLRKD